MASENSIWKFVKSERLIIVWWTLHLVGLLLIFGGRYPGILLLDLWLACSIACFALGSRRIKKLGAICLAFYAFFTLIVAGAMVYYLVSDGFFNYVKSNSRQATITNLGLKEIRRMPIPTPSLDEQQSIVDTLDSLKSKVDRLQANYDKISQECDALKQAILRQVFE